MIKNQDMQIDGDELDMEAPAWIRGENNLLFAMVERALQDLFLKADRDAAIDWLQDPDVTVDSVMSFPWAINQLGWDVSYWRKITDKFIITSEGKKYADRLENAVSNIINVARINYQGPGSGGHNRGSGSWSLDDAA